MKNRIPYIIVLAASLLLSATGVSAAPPVINASYPPLKVDSVEVPRVQKSYWQFGYDTLSTVYPSTVSPDYRDTVTAGAEMRYFVSPSVEASPEWFVYGVADTAIRDMWDTTRLESRFAWKVTSKGWAPADPSVVNEDSLYHPKFGSVAPYITKRWQKTPFHIVKWKRLNGKDFSTSSIPEADTLYVRELPEGFADNEGEAVAVPTRVIPPPAVTFLSGAELTECVADVSENNPYRFAPEIRFKTYVMGGADVQLVVAVRKDGAPWPGQSHGDADTLSLPTTPTATPTEGDAFAATITLGNLQFAEYGFYEVELVAISDRISRKCSVAGDVAGSSWNDPDVAGRNRVARVAVLPPPKMGAGYRKANRQRKE